MDKVNDYLMKLYNKSITWLWHGIDIAGLKKQCPKKTKETGFLNYFHFRLNILLW